MRRRRFLRTTAGATGGVATLAGCLGLGTPDRLDGDSFPVVHDWLTETEVGGRDGTYDGTVLDGRGRDEVRVDVGVAGNGGTYAFDPSAVAVSVGTRVRWVWVDDREGHNVVAAPDRQLGESDYAFRSGGPVFDAGHEYVRTLDRTGVALYHCEGIAGVSRGAASVVEPHAPGGAAVGGNRLSSDLSRGGGPPPVYHLEPHREHGMKGGIAVEE